MDYSWVLGLVIAAAAAAAAAYFMLKYMRKPASPYDTAPKGKVAEKDCKCPPGFFWTDTNSSYNNVYEHCRRRRSYNGSTLTDTTGCNMLTGDYNLPGTVIPKSQW